MASRNGTIPRPVAAGGLMAAALLLAACTTAGGGASPSQAQAVVNVQCGEGPADFPRWKEEFTAEAIAKGIDPDVVRSALADVTYSPRVIALDRDQSSFRLDFETFYARRVSDAMIARGRAYIRDNRALLDGIEARYGVPPEILVAIWALESSFGRFQGDLPILRSLATLAYDCRRQQFFSAELLDALRVIERGDLRPSQMRGAWAGEIGQTQFLMSRYYAHATDWDGDGRADLVRSVPDVLASTAAVLQADGWRRGEPWGKGTHNWHVIEKWNRADVYIETIATLAYELRGGQT